MTTEEIGEDGERPLVQGGERHKDRNTPEDELRRRLIQSIDSYAMQNGKTKDIALTTAINMLVKQKQGFS